MKDIESVMTTDVINVEQPEKNKALRKFRALVLNATKTLAIGTPLMFIFAGLGSKFGLWSWEFGLQTLTQKLGPILLIATAVMAVLSMILAAFAPKKGFWLGAFAMIVPLFGLGQLLNIKNKVDSLPYIHDITTNTQDVPEFTSAILSERAKVKNVNSVDYLGKMAPTQKKDADGKPVKELVAALQSKAYPKVRPLILSKSPEAAFTQVKALIKEMGWALKSEDAAAGIIEATDSTFWYGFKDDIVIRLRSAEGGGTVIDVRSVSRVGTSDIGANATRIRIFINKLSQDS